MLKFEGSERVTAEKALQHEYFRSGLVGVVCEHSEGYDSPHSSSSGLNSPTSILDLSTSTDSGIQES